MRALGDKSDEEATLDQVRINIAFEQMVFAVLSGALAGGALTFILRLPELFGGFSVMVFVSILLECLFLSILIFLVGFGASVAFGAPLFAGLEKRKQRNVWPYLGAALGVAIVAFVFLVVSIPSAGTVSFRTLAAIFIPAVVVAGVFARGMRPHWRAAEKAEAEAAAETEGPIVFKIH